MTKRASRLVVRKSGLIEEEFYSRETTLGDISDWIKSQRGLMIAVPFYFALLCFLFSARPGWLNRKVQIDQRYVIEGTQLRLHPWLEYIDEIEFYFTEQHPSGDPIYCSYSPGFGPLQNSIIYVYTNNVELWDYEQKVKNCLHHEIGHHIDRRNRISRTDDFKRAAALSVAMWAELPEGAYHWRMYGKMVAEFPGLWGNPLDENEWGGWKELYAELHEVDYLIQIPPPLQRFFKDYLYWNWWTPLY
jgi:hypothetical protein